MTAQCALYRVALKIFSRSSSPNRNRNRMPKLKFDAYM